MPHEVNGFPKVLIVHVHLLYLLCMFLLGIFQFSQQVVISSHQRPTATYTEDKWYTTVSWRANTHSEPTLPSLPEMSPLQCSVTAVFFKPICVTKAKLNHPEPNKAFLQPCSHNSHQCACHPAGDPTHLPLSHPFCSCRTCAQAHRDYLCSMMSRKAHKNILLNR